MSIEIIMYIVWAAIAILSCVIELNTQIQMGYAAFGASIFAIITNAATHASPIWAQIIVFLVLWGFLWVAFFIFFKRIRKAVHDPDDGYLAYIDKEVKVFKANDKEYGQIKFSAKIFRFVCKDKVKKGDLVIVKKIKGVTFEVEKVTKGEK